MFLQAMGGVSGGFLFEGLGFWGLRFRGWSGGVWGSGVRVKGVFDEVRDQGPSNLKLFMGRTG